MEKEMFDALVAKMKAVLKLLGFEIDKARESDRYYPTVWGKKGDAEIYMTSGDYATKDRIRISGNYPRSKKGEYLASYVRDENGDKLDANVSITVTTSKSAEKIANEIKARFLPEYEKVLAAVLKSKAATDGYADTKAANVKKLAAIVGIPVGANNEDSGEVSKWIDGGRLGIKTSDEDATVEVRLPIAEIEKVLKLIAEIGVFAGVES